MNLKEDFNKSFSYLMHNKKIIIPSFISFLIPFVLIILFIHMSGIFEFQQQLSASVTELEKMKDTNQLPFNQNSSAGSDSNITENEVYNSYMESRGVGFRDALKLVNFNNILLLVILILIWFVSSLYLSCMSYAIIAISLKEQITLRNLARMTNQYFLRLFSLRILIILIVIAPAFVLLGLALILWYVNKIAAGIAIFIFILLFLCYIIYTAFRLFFVLPSMFIEEVGPVDSLKHSVKLTHYHAKQVFMIMAIILGLGLFLNTFITNPLTETYKSLIFPASIALAAVNSIVLILFLLIEAFLSTFEHLFFFYAYLDFEKMEVKNDKSGN